MKKNQVLSNPFTNEESTGETKKNMKDIINSKKNSNKDASLLDFSKEVF